MASILDQYAQRGIQWDTSTPGSNRYRVDGGPWVNVGFNGPESATMLPMLQGAANPQFRTEGVTSSPVRTSDQLGATYNALTGQWSTPTAQPATPVNAFTPPLPLPSTAKPVNALQQPTGAADTQNYFQQLAAQQVGKPIDPATQAAFDAERAKTVTPGSGGLWEHIGNTVSQAGDLPSSPAADTLRNFFEVATPEELNRMGFRDADTARRWLDTAPAGQGTVDRPGVDYMAGVLHTIRQPTPSDPLQGARDAINNFLKPITDPINRMMGVNGSVGDPNTPDIRFTVPVYSSATPTPNPSDEELAQSISNNAPTDQNQVNVGSAAVNNAGRVPIDLNTMQPVGGVPDSAIGRDIKAPNPVNSSGSLGMSPINVGGNLGSTFGGAFATALGGQTAASLPDLSKPTPSPPFTGVPNNAQASYSDGGAAPMNSATAAAADAGANAVAAGQHTNGELSPDGKSMWQNGILVPLVAGALGAAGSIGGAVIESQAQKDAAAQQQKGVQDAIAAQQGDLDKILAQNKEQFNQQQTNAQPWIDTGKGALHDLWNTDKNGLIQTYSPPEYKDFNFSTTGANADPSYSFRLSEGLKALENSAAARGGLLSGNTGKALTNYGQNAASQEYQNAFTRYNQEYQNKFNNYQTQYGTGLNALQSIAGLGQTAVGQANNASQNYANNATQAYGNNASGVSNALMAGANAQAAGTTGSANALASGLVGASNSLTSLLNGYYANQQSQNMLKALMGSK